MRQVTPEQVPSFAPIHDPDDRICREFGCAEPHEFGHRHPRLHGSCTCRRWHATGYTCRECLTRDHTAHVEEQL